MRQELMGELSPDTIIYLKKRGLFFTTLKRIVPLGTASISIDITSPVAPPPELPPELPPEIPPEIPRIPEEYTKYLLIGGGAIALILLVFALKRR